MHDTRRTGPPQGFFGYLGLLLVRLRWAVVVFWAAVALAVYFYLPPLDDATTARVSDLVPESAPAARAESETEENLSGPVEAPAVLVFSNPDGFDARDLRAIQAGLSYLNGPDAPYRLGRAEPLVLEGPVPSPDPGLEGRKVLPVLLFFERGISPTGVGTGVGQTRAALEDLPAGLVAEVTGPQPIQDDNEAAIVNNLWLVTLATAAVIYLIVAFTYRSPLTPLVPLAGVGLSIFLTLRILARVASETGTELPSQVEPIITVLLFGVGTDYTLFLLSRTRQALAGGANRIEAARIGVERVGGVLLSSAMVLIAAFGLLVFSTLGIYQALGPGLGIALTVVFLVTLTLVPALLAILGRAAFGRLAAPQPVSGVTVSPLLRRPGLTAGVLVAALLVLATGVLGLRVGFDQVENLPDGAPAVEGYELLAEGFPQGVLAPVNVLIEGEGVAYRDEELRRLKSRLLGSGGFAAAMGAEDSGMLPGVDFAAEDGSAVRFLLVFYGAPYSSEALDQARRLQENLPELLDASGLEAATGTVGGQTALAAAARDTSNDDLLRLAPLVFAVSFLVLALLLRTPVAPLYLLFATVLSFAATIGVSTVLFQNVLGQGGVVYYVPFSLFLLLVALGSDYNIFIMAAIREEARERPLREAVPLALRKTGPTITAAGFALAASFALLALIPLQDFFQVGVAVAFGILLDAFVIRTMLVPAFALLAGRRGFWPTKVR
ncbi:MAG: MMPL family transporter [Rubrobacteraceae bacterium]